MTNISIDRILPNDINSENAILGAILLEQTALFAARECLCGDEFYLEANRVTFSTMLEMQKSEIGIDLITLMAELRRTNKLEMCGGPARITSLTEGIPRALNVKHYAGMVREAAILRKVIQLGNDAMARAYQAEEPAKGIIEGLQLELLKLSESSKNKGGWIEARELVSMAYKEIELSADRKTGMSGLNTGFRQLNWMTQGFHRGHLVIIAGRPGHGKTSLATNILTNGILKYGWRVGLFTIEMSAVEIMKRALYSEANVDSHRGGNGYLTPEDWNRLNRAASLIAETKLSVDDSRGLTIHDIRGRAQSLAVKGGLDLIVIDYLQLMSGSAHLKNNRVAEISEISRGLKTLAGDLNVPILALSQLNRAIENEKDRKPMLADLRESGSIEQDADMVLFIWREELRSHKDDDRGVAELIIGKQRNGPTRAETPTGNINLAFLPNITKFVDATPQQSELITECY